MNNRILIPYATCIGSTSGVAEEIGRWVQSYGTALVRRLKAQTGLCIPLLDAAAALAVGV